MNTTLFETIVLTDLHPATDTFLVDVLEGLGQAQKTIPAKYFYDARGSYLFDQITKLEEYYPTRTEMGIMKAHIGAMVERIGSQTGSFQVRHEAAEILIDRAAAEAATKIRD